MPRSSRTRLVLLVGALTAILIAVAAAMPSKRSSAGAEPRQVVLAEQAAQLARATVINVPGAEFGRPIPSGFVGLSLEYGAVEPYAGYDPSAINPVFAQLVRNLAPGQVPILRIGGDSTDWAWWPVPGMQKPRGVSITLTPGWLSVTRALTRTLSARLLLGIDLEADSARLAATEAHAFVSGLGQGSIEALELGNEPELYAAFIWNGSGAPGRAPGYGPPTFNSDFARIGAVLPRLPLAGPAIGAPGWFRHLPPFLAAEPRLGVVTLHRYPLQRCFISRSSPQFPTLPHLFAPASSRGLADSLAPYTGLVHARGLSMRIDEMNTVSCGGAPGISDTFASALWAVDALFDMARVGVDGVNIHTFPKATYELFSFARAHGSWRGFVRPEYYGLMLFAQAAPPGSRLLRLAITRRRGIKAWATRAPDGRIRVVLIDEGGSSRLIALRIPGAAAVATMQLLRAPSVSARTGVSLGGQSFGSQTLTGKLAGKPTSLSTPRTGGDYMVDLPAASAALITVPGS